MLAASPNISVQTGPQVCMCDNKRPDKKLQHKCAVSALSIFTDFCCKITPQKGSSLWSLDLGFEFCSENGLPPKQTPSDLHENCDRYRTPCYCLCPQLNAKRQSTCSHFNASEFGSRVWLSVHIVLSCCLFMPTMVMSSKLFSTSL